MFLAIAVLTMVTTMNRITAKEKTQIGTFKALGYRDRRIAMHYTSYATAIGLIGTAFGIGFGVLIAWYIMNPNGSMGTYIDFVDWSLYCPAFVWIVLIVINLFITQDTTGTAHELPIAWYRLVTLMSEEKFV